MELVKLSSLVVSWIDQTLKLLLSATSVDVLDARERGRGSWSGSLSPRGGWPSDSARDRVTRSVGGTVGLLRFGGIYLKHENFQLFLTRM